MSLCLMPKIAAFSPLVAGLLGINTFFLCNVRQISGTTMLLVCPQPFGLWEFYADKFRDDYWVRNVQALATEFLT